MESNNKFLIPAAIVVAGLLVAGAVVFKNKAGGPGAGQPTEPNQPAEVKVNPITASDHIFGNPGAAVKIVEFSDIDCPFCQTFHQTLKRVMDEYGKDGKVAWVYRHFPLDQLHPEARIKAESTECVAELAGNDAFWKYLDLLFARDEKAAGLGAIAAEAGVNQAVFQSCVESKKHAALVKAQGDEAIAAGGRGTPYSVIIDAQGKTYPINGAQPYEVVKQVIDTALLGR